MMRKFIFGAAVAGLIATLPNLAWAHTDEHLATVEAPHGGQLRAAGPFHLELVAKDGELLLYITDHMDNKIPAEGGSGKANIFDEDGEKISVPFEPVFGNFMKATGDFKITPETVVSVFVVLDGHETQGARFTPLAPKSPSQDHHDHDHDHFHGSDETHDDGRHQETDGEDDIY
jgi:hypothetical protein